MAIIALHTPLEAEAAALATDLGSTAYEQRLHLTSGTPAVVLTTPDPDRARALLRSVRGRGHEAVAFDASAIVPSGEMLPLRRGRLDPEGITAEEPAATHTPGALGRLPFEDILALIRASQRVRLETTVEVKEQKIGLGRAVTTGGLVMTKTVTRQQTRVSDERAEVLYLYRRSGELPWILRERSASYTWLGDRIAPVSLQNFRQTVALLRERAPRAHYDERLTGPRRALPAAGEPSAASSDPTADLLAHALALWASRQAPA
ncbi:Hypothetical protein CAP_6421 [Chondromyces apiculatus DSM 436]|uniref:Uncharacterized protein n=1 Tax=Chondromyces apiculatus DSM 436 TaxID=1192034 RepID=A0A017T2Q5_9BACT|nr:Hypothetical protein CAP_6421 [Chondromyces apiculatus DSM 436]